MKNVYVFIIPDVTGNLNTSCTRCGELMDLLTQESISFTKVNINESTSNMNLWKNLKEQCPGILLIFPTVFLQDNDDGSGFVFTPGRDFFTPTQAVDLIKKHLL